MADKSPIEWTEATWNPVVGCSIFSPGCTHCYAMKMAARIEAMSAATGRDTHYAGTTKPSKAGPVWTGKLAFAPEHILTEPLRWRRPRRIFVNSMSDLFHEDVPDEWIDQVFAVMALAPQHTFQVLTKRASRMREYLTAFADRGDGMLLRLANAVPAGDWPITKHEALARLHPDTTAEHRALYRAHAPVWPLPNVWLGVSTERQQEADERVPELLATPAAVRFVSAEPLLGPIDFQRWLPNCYECGASCGLRLPTRPDVERCTDCGEECGPDTEPQISEGCPRCAGELEPVCPDCGHYMVYQHPDTPNIDLIIVGGESGHEARPMHPDWARSIRDQCAAGTAFFFKQWGTWSIAEEVSTDGLPRFWRFADGDEFHIISDGHDIIMAEAQDSTTPHHIWNGYWADGHGNLAKKPGKKRAGRLLDGREHNDMPEVRP